MRIHRRKDHWLGAQHTKILRAKGLGHNVLGLVGAPVIARELASVDDIGIERVGSHVAILFCGHRMPLANRNLAIIAPAGDADRAALLLSAANPVWKRIVGAD